MHERTPIPCRLFNLATVLTVAVWVLLARQSLADSVIVDGSMRTTADLTDKFVLHVPEACGDLLVRIPVPSDASALKNRLGSNPKVADVSVTTTLPTLTTSDGTDLFGNRYKVLTCGPVVAGDYLVEAKFSQIDISTDLDAPLSDTSFPESSDAAIAAPYLVASPGAQSDSPAIRTLSRQITAGAHSQADAASAISLWLMRNIHYGVNTENGKIDAVSVLHSRTSLCDGLANLFIALARASDIPARFIGGYTLGGRIEYPTSADRSSMLTSHSMVLAHAWVEVWYPGSGWVPYEPQQTAAFIDTHHMRVWAAPDAQSDLPFLSWHGRHSHTMPISFVEEENVANVLDDFDLKYIEGEAIPGEPALIERKTDRSGV